MEYKIDKFFRHVQNFNVSHYVWIYEKEEWPVYESLHTWKQSGTLDDHLKKVARVVATKKINKKTFFYMEVEQKEIGWAELKRSKVIYSKPREHVKLNMERYEETKKDQILPLSAKNLDLIENQMLDSRFVMIRNGRQYEALFRGVEMQGWFTEDTLFKSQKVKLPAVGYDRDIKLFGFNNLTSEIKIDHERLEPINVIHLFKDLGLVKVKTGMGNFWTEMKYLDIGDTVVPDYEAPYSFEEMVVYDLIQNISEERNMTLQLVERLKNQYLDEGYIVVKKTEEEELKDQLNLLKNELEKERNKRKRVSEKYNNLKNSLLGKLQVKYWKKRK